MRTRYQHGNLQLDERMNGPDVWVYRWREYLPGGKTQRRGEMVGTIEEYPTKADAQKASEHLRRFWTAIQRRKCQNVTLLKWHIGLTSKRTSGPGGATCH
jgi:hypothetical protein